MGHDQLAALCEDFPQFQVWREDCSGRVRYVARRRMPGQHPHLVITDDLEELRAVLAGAPPAPARRTAAGWGVQRFDPDVAHPARVYGCWLGSKDNYPADRQAAEDVAARRPQVVASARANRAFGARVVRFLAGQREITQFVDIGAGLPAAEATHQVAQDITPGARVVYVDHDPLVLTHARALLTSSPEGRCDYVDADLRDPKAILQEAARTLDFTRPVAVLLLAVAHFLADADDPAGVVAALAAGLAPGSFIALSHLTADFAPEQVAAGVTAYNARVPAGITARSHAQVSALLGGLGLVPPGVVPVTEWRPGHAGWPGHGGDLYAGVAVVRRPR
ncbi:MAG TPA: SAM-dependent methyltransferase [Streptosporangiaceae bacterium]|jgi:O-methyltransferase involved in polyketide biosynthesis